MPGSFVDLLEVALHAALTAGEVLRSELGVTEAEAKGAGDYVTKVDRRSEAEIRRILAEATPGIPMIGEEEGGSAAERYWLVDPLDGTTNFLHGLPIVGVSVALVEAGRPAVGVVHGPFLDQTFTAVEGAGSHLRRGGEVLSLTVSARRPAQAVVATGFPFRDKSLLPRYLPVFERCFERFEDLRRPGAAALDLSWVAAGVFEGFFELSLSPWDVAAGALLVREAGGVVTDWDGGDTWLETGDILAGSPTVHEALLEIAAG